MPRISYAEVRDAISIQFVLDVIGYKQLRQSSMGAYGPCPFRCCRHQHCFRVKLSDNLWYCHLCKRGGTQLDLFCMIKGLSLYSGAVRLCELAGIPIPYLDPPPDRYSPA